MNFLKILIALGIGFFFFLIQLAVFHLCIRSFVLCVMSVTARILGERLSLSRIFIALGFGISDSLLN